MDLTDKWEAGTLTQEDVFDWILGQKEQLLLLPITKVDHVAMCLHHIYLWHMKGHELGSFLMAVVYNDFKDACLRADETNVTVLPLYAKFLYQVAPKGYEIQRKYVAVES